MGACAGTPGAGRSGTRRPGSARLLFGVGEVGRAECGRWPRRPKRGAVTLAGMGVGSGDSRLRQLSSAGIASSRWRTGSRDERARSGGESTSNVQALRSLLLDTGSGVVAESRALLGAAWAQTNLTVDNSGITKVAKLDNRRSRDDAAAALLLAAGEQARRPAPVAFRGSGDIEVRGSDVASSPPERVYAALAAAAVLCPASRWWSLSEVRRQREVGVSPRHSAHGGRARCSLKLPDAVLDVSR